MNKVIHLTLPVLTLCFSLACSTQNNSSQDSSGSSAVEACSLCHGGLENAAPPTDLAGNAATTARGVGAHQSHLLGSAWAAPVACKSCHIVPENSTDAGHADDALPAEVVFAGIATTGDLSPSWDGTTCQNTWCHGATLTGGTNTQPTWTAVDTGQVECGTCHGLPPALPHPQNTQCEACHSITAGENLTIVNAATHVNGIIEVDSNISCSLCHGGADNAAPPTDLAGNTSTSERGVGAHQTHVAAANLSSPIPCSECHVEPTSVTAEGHLDESTPADVLFGTIATTNGYVVTTVPNWSVTQTDPRSPAWNEATCANTYCHNPNEDDTNATTHAPTWTLVDGSQIQCDSCHGFPPSGHDSGLTTCSNCHPATVAGPDQDVITGKDKHVNGEINFGL